MFLVVLMYALTTLPLSKALIACAQPFFLIGLRMACAGIILCLFYYLFQKNTFIIARKHTGYFLQAILFAILVPYFLRYWGLANGSQPRADLLYMAGPLITYILASSLGIEIITRTKTIALALGYCGLFFYFGNPLQSYLLMPFGFADLAIIASVVSFTYGWIIIRHLIVDHNYNPIMINGITMLCAGLVALTISSFAESITINGNISEFSLLLAAVIIISNLWAHTIYASLLKKYSLTFIQLCGFAAPLLIEYRHIIFGSQSLSISCIIATIMSMASIGLFFTAEHNFIKLWRTHTID